jgi:hypothetical protein
MEEDFFIQSSQHVLMLLHSKGVSLAFKYTYICTSMYKHSVSIGSVSTEQTAIRTFSPRPRKLIGLGCQYFRFFTTCIEGMYIYVGHQTRILRFQPCETLLYDGINAPYIWAAKF